MLALTLDKTFPPPTTATQDRAAFHHDKQSATKAATDNWFDLILPASAPPVNVCTSVNTLYPKSRLDAMPPPPRLPRRRKPDVNPFRDVGVYQPPEDYERPSLQSNAGVAVRSAPPVLPSNPATTRKVRCCATPERATHTCTCARTQPHTHTRIAVACFTLVLCCVVLCCVVLLLFRACVCMSVGMFDCMCGCRL